MMWYLLKIKATGLAETVHVYNPSYLGGGGRSAATRGQPQANVRPHLKNKLKQKQVGVVAEMVEHLTSK
jgi:hypothetical protein